MKAVDGGEIQAGSHPELERPEDVAKFFVGAELRFLSYAPGELVPDVPFSPGTLLVVLPRNGCGLGIDVEEVATGRTDMVFPEEVELMGDLS